MICFMRLLQFITLVLRRQSFCYSYWLKWTMTVSDLNGRSRRTSAICATLAITATFYASSGPPGCVELAMDGFRHIHCQLSLPWIIMGISSCPANPDSETLGALSYAYRETVQHLLIQCSYSFKTAQSQFNMQGWYCCLFLHSQQFHWRQMCYSPLLAWCILHSTAVF